MRYLTIILMLFLGMSPCLGEEGFQPDYDKYSQLQHAIRKVIDPIRHNKEFQSDHYVYKSKDATGRSRENEERLRLESNAVYKATLSVLKGLHLQEIIDSDRAEIKVEFLDARILNGMIIIAVNDGLYRIIPEVKDGIIIDIGLSWKNIDAPWDDPIQGKFQPCEITKNNHKSGKGECLAPPPHTTGHAGPHPAVRKASSD